MLYIIKSKKVETMDLYKIAGMDGSLFLKIAAITEGVFNGEITPEEADDAAMGMGVDPSDLANIYQANFGEIEKTAMEEAGYTYLEKVATVVDAYYDGKLSDEELYATVDAEGLAFADVESISNMAYGESEFEKTAADEEYEALEKVAYITEQFFDEQISEYDIEPISDELGVNPEAVVYNIEKLAAEAEEKGIWNSIKKGGRTVRDKTYSAGNAIKSGAISTGKHISKHKGKYGAGAALAAAGGGGAYYYNQRD